MQQKRDGTEGDTGAPKFIARADATPSTPHGLGASIVDPESSHDNQDDHPRRRARQKHHPKKEWIRRSRSGSRGPFYLAKTSMTDGVLGGDPSAGSPTDTLFTGSPCRHGAWTVSSSDVAVGARRAVSEGSDPAIGLPCGLSAPAPCDQRTICVGSAGSSEFPAYSQVCSGPSRVRSRNTFTT
jgi:hypothetical protein